MALSEHKKIALTRQVHAIMQSPQGRDFGRVFLEELGKGDKGDFPGALNESLDIIADVIRSLYRAEAPVQGR
jgi:hypothetical protein